MIIVWLLVGLFIAAVVVINPALRKVGIVAFVIGGVLLGLLSSGSHPPQSGYALMWLMFGVAVAIYIGGWIVDAFTD